MYEWKSPQSTEEMLHYGSQLKICLGNVNEPVSLHCQSNQVVPYFLVTKATDIPVAAALYHPEWEAMSTVAGMQARPLINGEFMEEIVHLLNILDVKQTLNSSLRKISCVKISGKWMNTRQLVQDDTISHTLDLTNYTHMTPLPEGLIVYGDLILARTNLTELPQQMTVLGKLDIRFSPIWQISEGVTYQKIITSGGKVF
jgi:hypothetical protein